MATTSDSTVYIRVRPNDGTVDADAWATSTAFGIDNVSPAGPPESCATDSDCWSADNIAAGYTIWSTEYVNTGAQSATDGKANSDHIMASHANANPWATNNYPAIAACDQYTGDGHSDWYLPSKQQLADAYGVVSGFQSDNYWSSTEYSDNPGDGAWDFHMDNGYAYYNGKDFPFFLVRCLRDSAGGIPAPTFGTITASSIIVNKPAGVTDSGSGLEYWRVRRGGDTESSWIAIGTNTYESTPLSDNTQYTYDVQFKDTAGNISSYSTSASETTLVANIAPNAPTLVSPENATYIVNGEPTLSANYSDNDAGDVGTTNYRISTSSLADCTANTNVIAFGTSTETALNNATTTWTPGSVISPDATYYWCTQNDDGALTSDWTQMGSFILDTTLPILNSVYIYSNNANPGTAKTADVVTLEFTSDSVLQNPPVVTIAGKSASVYIGEIDKSGRTWYALRTLDGTETVGNLGFTINYVDIPGNAGLPVYTVTDGSSVTFYIPVVRSSGGSVTPACTYNDPAWSTCVNSKQTRTLTANNQTCLGDDPKVEEQTCVMPVIATSTASTTIPVATSTATTTIPVATSTATTTATTTLEIATTTATTTEIVIATTTPEQATTTEEITLSTSTEIFFDEKGQPIEVVVDSNGDIVTTVNENSNVDTSARKESAAHSSSDNKTGIAVIDNIVSALDVSSFVKDNVAVLGTTTERIILGAQKILESPAGSAVAQTITTVGVVGGGVAATGVFALNGTVVADLLFLPFKLWGLLLSVLGLKKRNRPWGTVYDSVTKQPIDPAYVTLTNLKTKEEITSITDLDGRYGFLVGPGKYSLAANKTNYTFPSQKLAGKTADVLYGNLYFGGEIEILVTGAVISRNIPLDPVKFDWNEFTKGKKKLMKFYSKREKITRILTDWLFRIGFGISLLSLFLVSAPYNLIIFGLYLVLYAVRKIGLKQKALGSLTNKNGDPLSFAIVRIFDAELNVEITNKVANQVGKYYCLVNKGKYYVKIEKKNDDESYTEVFTSGVFEIEEGIVNKNFVV